MDDAVSSWCGDLTAADRKNLWRVQIWALLWAVVFTGSSLLLKRWPELVPGLAVGAALVALSTVLGVVMVLAFVRFLREADELVRRIHLEALAVSFGATLVITTSWRLVERLGAPKGDISDALLPMMGVWIIAQIVTARRYR